MLKTFTKEDAKKFTELSMDEKPKYKAFDTSIMDCADDIAFCTHDLEDVIARKIISKEEFLDKFNTTFSGTNKIACNNHKFEKKDFENMFEDAYQRKTSIGKLVNMFITTCEINERLEFEHPLLRFHFTTNPALDSLIEFLKTDITYDMVISRPHVCMLEKKGQKIISALFDNYCDAPEKLIPHWHDMDPSNTKKRKICDYIAGMTDSYAEKMYHRMFTPGYGSSMDEL